MCVPLLRSLVAAGAGLRAACHPSQQMACYSEDSRRGARRRGNRLAKKCGRTGKQRLIGKILGPQAAPRGGQGNALWRPVQRATRRPPPARASSTTRRCGAPVSMLNMTLNPTHFLRMQSSAPSPRRRLAAPRAASDEVDIISPYQQSLRLRPGVPRADVVQDRVGVPGPPRPGRLVGPSHARKESRYAPSAVSSPPAAPPPGGAPE